MNAPILSIRGIYRDVLTTSDRRVVHDSGWVRNTIVTSCRVLLSGFMKNESSAGIQYLAVGSGNASWDSVGVPPTDPDTTTNLVQRYSPPIPVGDLEVEYLDVADEVQSAPSPRLQITATLPAGYPPPLPDLTTCPLREFGLFGSLNGRDFMINSIRHPVIHKDESATLIRVVRLYL